MEAVEDSSGSIYGVVGDESIPSTDLKIRSDPGRNLSSYNGIMVHAGMWKQSWMVRFVRFVVGREDVTVSTARTVWAAASEGDV